MPKYVRRNLLTSRGLGNLKAVSMRCFSLRQHFLLSSPNPTYPQSTPHIPSCQPATTTPPPHHQQTFSNVKPPRTPCLGNPPLALLFLSCSFATIVLRSFQYSVEVKVYKNIYIIKCYFSSSSKFLSYFLFSLVLTNYIFLIYFSNGTQSY